MPDKKISQLSSGGNAQTTDQFLIARSGDNFRVAGTDIAAAATKLGTITTGVWQGTAIVDTYIDTITTAGKVANSATTATSSNTANAIVARDASGNFTAGTVSVTNLLASGSAAFGVTLPTIVSSSRILQVGRGVTIEGSTTVVPSANNTARFSSNSILDSSGARSYIYGTTRASEYLQDNGVHSWSTAPQSINAGDPITFTRQMILNRDSQLAIGANALPINNNALTVIGGGSAPGALAIFSIPAQNGGVSLVGAANQGVVNILGNSNAVISSFGAIPGVSTYIKLGGDPFQFLDSTGGLIASISTTISSFGELIAKTPIRTETTNYSISQGTDSVVLANASSGTQTLTLPSAVAAGAGRSFTIKRLTASGAATITVATTSAQTIDGASTVTLSNQYDAITVVSTGTAWSIIHEVSSSVILEA